MKWLENLVTDLRFLLGVGVLTVAGCAYWLFTPVEQSDVQIAPTSPVIDDTSSGMPVQLILTAALIGLLFATLVLLLGLSLSGADSESKKIARKITSTDIAETLLERWLRRSRFYRFTGGLLALCASPLLLDNDDGSTQVLFVMLCGVAFGGALAEVHVLRRRRGTVAAADLTVRTVRDFTDPTDLLAMAVVAATGLLALAAAVFGWNTNVSVRWCLGAIGSITAVLWFQYIVARRSRPALSPELHQADNLLRYLAATQGFARPAIAAAFVMVANAIGREESGVLAFSSTALVLVGVVWWYRGRHGRIPKLAQGRLAA